MTYFIRKLSSNPASESLVLSSVDPLLIKFRMKTQHHQVVENNKITQTARIQIYKHGAEQHFLASMVYILVCLLDCQV